MTTPDPTMLAVLTALTTGMSTAIGVLWKQVMSHLKAIETKLNLTEKRLVDCESDRLAIWRKLAEQSGKEVDEYKNGEEK
mgnify:FL=1